MYENIAKSEQSSHTPSDSHQRSYYLNSFERKKNAQIKGQISNMWLHFLYTVQLVISDVCTNFQNSRPEVVPEKSLTKISILIKLIGVRDRKKEK